MYDSHRFCWHGVVSRHPEHAIAFYAKVLGWELANIRIGHGASPVFEVGGIPIAHLKQAGPGTQSHWECLLRVDDVAGRANLAEMNGGRILVPPTDVAAGRISVVASPSGAPLYLFHEIDESSQHHPGGPGGIEWVELHSTAPDADLAWLTSTFRFETSRRPDVPHAILSYKGQPRAGVTLSSLPNLAPMWIAWIAVANLDEVISRVQRMKGTVITEPVDSSDGRRSLVADSTHTVFGLIEKNGAARA